MEHVGSVVICEAAVSVPVQGREVTLFSTHLGISETTVSVPVQGREVTLLKAPTRPLISPCVISAAQQT